MTSFKSPTIRNLLLAASAASLVAACTFESEDDNADSAQVAEQQATPDYGYETYSEDNLADSMASNDERYLSQDSDNGEDTASSDDDMAQDSQSSDMPDAQDRPTMRLQVVLDRTGFGPGVIDGKMGMSTENALRGFQEANGLEVTGQNDAATKEALGDWDAIPATRVVTIPTSWAQESYTDIPEDTAAKAELERMGYKSLEEKLAERFHTTAEVLRRLNPNGKPAGSTESEQQASESSSDSSSSSTGSADSYFTPGQQIRVPNIGADRIAPGSVEDGDWQRTLASLGVGTQQPEVDRIVVSKAGKTLKAYNGEELVALFTVSSGSSQFPLPLGEWDIQGKAYMPDYRYDPEVLAGSDAAQGEVYTLPPGPNSPVGVVWIDLSKEHYGIHGTPDPETIGRAQSSGCVRLTNWDAARLAQMVSQSTEVIFEA